MRLAWPAGPRSSLTRSAAAPAWPYMGVTTTGLEDEDPFWSTPVDRETLKAKLAGWDPRITRLIDAAPPATAYGLHDSTPLPRWNADRVCLLGDACHAMLPFQAQGAAQAIEDASVLGALLSRVEACDVPRALSSYAALRQPRTAQVQDASRANRAQWHLPDGRDQEQRDAALRGRRRRLRILCLALERGPGPGPVTDTGRCEWPANGASRRPTIGALMRVGRTAFQGPPTPFRGCEASAWSSRRPRTWSAL